MLLKTYVISDIHTDVKENLAWIADAVETIRASSTSFHLLVVAGDVSDKQEVLLETFQLLSGIFDVVFFTPGNHDVWVNKGQSSVKKHQEIRDLLEAKFTNVFCSPVRVTVSLTAVTDDEVDDPQHEGSRRIALIPVFGWHSETFDLEAEIPSSELCNKEIPTLNKVVSDRTRAVFPISEIMEEKQAAGSAALTDAGLLDVYDKVLEVFRIQRKGEVRLENWDSPFIAWKMDRFNLTCGKGTRRIEIYKPSGSVLLISGLDVNSLLEGKATWQSVLGGFDQVITYSHFLPFPFLNPEKRFLFYPLLAKVIGSELLGQRVLQLLPNIHVFGHTHFGWAGTLQDLLEGQGVQDMNFLEEPYKRLVHCRFIQAPLGYPRERQIRLRSLSVGPFNSTAKSRQLTVALELHHDLTFHVPAHTALWSNFYNTTARDPGNTVTAEYVKQLYAKTAF